MRSAPGLICSGFLLPVAIGAALLTTTQAHAAGKATCDKYVAEAIAAAEKVRPGKLDCGFDLNHPQWSDKPEVHMRWCLSSKEETVEQESENRSKTLGRCYTCRGYADFALEQIKQIAEVPVCKVYIDSEPAYSSSASVHFDWCMGLRDDGSSKAVFDQRGKRAAYADSCRTIAKHGYGLTADDTRAVLYKRVPSAMGPAAARKPVDAALKRSSSGAADKVKPSKSVRASRCKPGEANDPCKPKPEASSSSGAMDRLGSSASTASGAGGGSGSDGGRAGAKSSAGVGGTTPGGGSASGGAGGGGAGVSTFRSPSNMVAPPAGGGLR